MSRHALRLLEDRLEIGAEVAGLPSLHRVVYVVEGTVVVAADGGEVEFGPNSAWFGTGHCALRAGPQGARLWRWELLDLPVQGDGTIGGQGVASALKECREIELDAAGEYLMRCDRVDFPLGGVAYTHTHPGPGIRCLLQGQIAIEVEGRTRPVEVGESWFERGPDPVLATASSTTLTGFVRSMILPRALKGISSIQYVRQEDQDKPKQQEYTRFVDEFIEIQWEK